jgi:hypothetical protein
MTLRTSLNLAVRVKSYMPYILEEDITVYPLSQLHKNLQL